MDKKKQPGIHFNSIILVESNFFRDTNVPNDMKTEVSVSVGNNVNQEKTQCNVDMTFELTGRTSIDEVCLKIKSRFIAFFKTEEDKCNMEIEKFANENAPVLMIPYIREYLSNVTSRAGIETIILPPINIFALMNKEDESQ